MSSNHHNQAKRLSVASLTVPMRGPRRMSNVSYTPISGISAGRKRPDAHELEGVDMEKEGLGVVMAAVFLAGEMAGSGVLAMPAAMIGTGFYGVLFVVLFTVNACYTGSRLGECWVILQERYPEEFRGIIRDPYPTIGEKTVGKWGRYVSVFCIIVTLYGAGTVFIVLISQLFRSIFINWAEVNLSLCLWMVLVAALLIPLTWMGTPKDFWPIAVGALLTTVTACTLIVIQSALDYSVRETEVTYPSPTIMGTFKAFGSVMYAYAGASTFPTIQADMKRREKFNVAAVSACVMLFLIYFPMALGPYFSFGSGCKSNIVLSISTGYVRLVVEIMLLLHLITAFPILTNPPAQFLEFALNIPEDFGWKRVVFRSSAVLVLLFIAETIPSFGSILDLVGATTVTCLTFICPPYFYMKLVDRSHQFKDCRQRSMPLYERVYCWFLIILGIAGTCLSTYTAVNNIVNTDFKTPCYLKDGFFDITTGSNDTVELGGH